MKIYLNMENKILLFLCVCVGGNLSLEGPPPPINRQEAIRQKVVAEKLILKGSPKTNKQKSLLCYHIPSFGGYS